MSVGICFKWLDLLENEFDKNFVDLDILLNEFEECQEFEVVCLARKKMTGLGSCFAQLAHKALTAIQSNVKLEAELVNLKAELIESETTRKASEIQVRNMLAQLHSCQLQSLSQKGIDGDSENIRKKLEAELVKETDTLKTQLVTKEENTVLNKENENLRKYILSLHSEIYGARLAAKYLDKELAGRIQQIQLLGRNLKGINREGLWTQLEAEIYLHRQKTVMRVCRNRQRKKQVKPSIKVEDMKCNGQFEYGYIRTVQVQRNETDSLGISITGGREHGVPILVSEIHDDGVIQKKGEVYVGDAILSVNNINLRKALHQEAVNILSSVKGLVTLELMYIPSDSDTENEQDDMDPRNLKYNLFDPVTLGSDDPDYRLPLVQSQSSQPSLHPPDPSCEVLDQLPDSGTIVNKSGENGDIRVPSS